MLPVALAVAALLVLFWWLAVSASRVKSQTSDELPHLTAGFAYDKFGDFRMQPENGNLPQRLFGLPGLLADARSRARQSVSLHDYVQTLNQSLDAAGKRRLIAMLWQVAVADGRVDKYEEHLLRRLVDLLYIPMADYVQAREDAVAASRVDARG